MARDFYRISVAKERVREPRPYGDHGALGSLFSNRLIPPCKDYFSVRYRGKMPLLQAIGRVYRTQQ